MLKSRVRNLAVASIIAISLFGCAEKPQVINDVGTIQKVEDGVATSHANVSVNDHTVAGAVYGGIVLGPYGMLLGAAAGQSEKVPVSFTVHECRFTVKLSTGILVEFTAPKNDDTLCTTLKQGETTNVILNIDSDHVSYVWDRGEKYSAKNYPLIGGLYGEVVPAVMQ